MVSWILSGIDIKTRKITDHQEILIVSWKCEILSPIYKLNPLEIHLNADFLYRFLSIFLMKCQENYDIVIEDWLREEAEDSKLTAKKSIQ